MLTKALIGVTVLLIGIIPINLGEDTKETVHGAGNEEILATLKFLQEEVRRLSDELQARGIEEDVAQLKIDVDINSQLIKDTQADVEENYMSIVQNKFDLEKKITDVLPVGSIIPWSGQTVSHANLPDVMDRLFFRDQ